MDGGPLPGLRALPERSLGFITEEVTQFVQVALEVVPCFFLASFRVLDVVDLTQPVQKLSTGAEPLEVYIFYLLRAVRFSSAVMGGVEPNSKSIVNGIVTSRPGDLGVSSDVVFSSVRTVGSESVPVEVDEEGLLEPPPKRPLILSIYQLAEGVERNRLIPHL